MRCAAPPSSSEWGSDVAESIAINGTDLTTYLKAVQGHRGLIGAPPVRGADYELPRRDGALDGTRWAGPRVASIYGLLYGSSATSADPADARARFLDAYRGLSALLWNNGKAFTVTRVIPRVTGGDLTVAASGRYLGGLEGLDQVAHHAGRVAFDIQLLEPFWYPTTDTTLSTITTTLTPTIVGDVPTKRVTLTFSGVTATQRLTNNTTGEWVEVAGNSGAATVLDCLNFTATRSGSSVAGSVAHNGAFDDWLTLLVGVNSLTLTGGGQVVVAYRPAYV